MIDCSCVATGYDTVPPYAGGVYYRTKYSIISKAYHPFRRKRISLKSTTFACRQMWCFSWKEREKDTGSQCGHTARLRAKRSGTKAEKEKNPVQRSSRGSYGNRGNGATGGSFDVVRLTGFEPARSPTGT